MKILYLKSYNYIVPSWTPLMTMECFLIVHVHNTIIHVCTYLLNATQTPKLDNCHFSLPPILVTLFCTQNKINTRHALMIMHNCSTDHSSCGSEETLSLFWLYYCDLIELVYKRTSLWNWNYIRCRLTQHLAVFSRKLLRINILSYLNTGNNHY